MPQVQPEWPFPKPKNAGTMLVVGLICVGVVVGAGYVAWYYLGPPSATTTANAADQLNAAGDYRQAEAKLEQAYSRVWRKDDKALIISRLAATNVDMGNDGKALTYFEQLNSLDPNQFANLMNEGQVADRLGNKTVALAAYSQALAIRKTQLSHIYAQSEVDMLTSRVQELRQ